MLSMGTSFLRVRSFFVAIALSVSAHLSAATLYEVADLGTVDGDTVSLGRAINDQQQIAGFSRNNKGPTTHAALWSAYTGFRDINGPCIAFSLAKGINNRGSIVGRADRGDGKVFAFLWTPEDGMQRLDTAMDTFSSAKDINDQGIVVGVADIDCDHRRAVLWLPGRAARDLGTLGGANSNANAINSSGQVVGRAGLANGDAHAFVWSEREGMRDLGTLGGRVSVARDVNNDGKVVGFSLNQDGTSRAFLWQRDGGMRDLGGFEGEFSAANGINDQGQVVGVSLAKVPAAFVWDPDTGMLDLNGLIPLGSGWRLYAALSINNKGEITGFGQRDGLLRAFLLRPVEAVPPASAPAQPKEKPQPTHELGPILQKLDAEADSAASLREVTSKVAPKVKQVESVGKSRKNWTGKPVQRK